MTGTAGTDDRAPAADFGLRPRPTLDPALAALIAQAALELWPRPRAADPEAQAAREARAARAWRFSGRWWTRPIARHRDRPWVR